MNKTSSFDPETGMWNDSLLGDYLWSRNNFGEGRPDVMAPFTFSVSDKVWRKISLLPDYSLAGNICGRFYANVSVAMSLLTAMGRSVDSAKEQMAGLLGNVPGDLNIPLVPISRWTRLGVLPKAVRLAFRERSGLRQVPGYLETMPALCKMLNRRIASTNTTAALIEMWHNDVYSHLQKDIWVMAGGAQPLEALMKLKSKLASLVGEEDANTLFSSLSSKDDILASLGPVVGLARVTQAKMSRADYLEKYGHRGPHEAEFSLPRLAEDPDWLDKQLAEYEENPVDVDALLARRQAAFETAWKQLQAEYPGKARKLRRQIDKVGPASRMREAVRDEATRFLWVVRNWALRAGELSDLGEDIFLLTIDETLALLSGNDTATAYLQTRKETYEQYRALPPYPMIVRGKFDPFKWAANPNRRNDIYMAGAEAPVSSGQTIKGYAGAAGQVEGRVRVLDRPEQVDQLQPGEILVAVTTNVGWTPLFPRAAAIVTDVGAPLSHAAIVARELGIPAVVGCGSATTRLRTGDLIRVDGGQGLVEIMSDQIDINRFNSNQAASNELASVA